MWNITLNTTDKQVVFSSQFLWLTYPKGGKIPSDKVKTENIKRWRMQSSAYLPLCKHYWTQCNSWINMHQIKLQEAISEEATWHKICARTWNVENDRLVGNAGPLNIAENQILAWKCQRKICWQFRVENCRWTNTFSGKPPPPCENILHQQDMGVNSFESLRTAGFKRMDLWAVFVALNLCLISHYLK